MINLIPQEACDGAAQRAGVTCSDTCDAPGTTFECTCCGDGVQQPGEACDDGNDVDGDACRNNCTKCGDGVIQAGEACDGNAQATGVTCSDTCDAAGTTFQCTCCGDGVQQPGEACDDGNDIDTDACKNDCTSPCSVTIDKTVARDNDCNGTADGAFHDSEVQESAKCLVYKICVTNTGQQALDGTGVTVSDTHLGTLTLNFGPIAATNPDTTVCKDVPGTANANPASACPGGHCVCTDVDGINTAVVTSAICQLTNVNACIQTGSDCSDDTPVDCCDVRVDKQISCTGAEPFYDAGLVKNNNDGTNGPPAAPPCLTNDLIYVRYQVENVGQVDVFNCTLGESNVTVQAGGIVQNLFGIAGSAIAGGLPFIFPFQTSRPICSAATAGGAEPDTATLDCSCVVPTGLSPLPVHAEDKATVTCIDLPCSVSIDKTVAPDIDCDGVADVGSTFLESVEVDKIECVVYKICVTNTGDQTLNTSHVTVSDTKLGIVDYDFGTILATNPDTTVCKLVASEISSPKCLPITVEGPDVCLCQDVEGTNTATVSSAICLLTQADACIQTGSKCSDNARVNCTGGCRITAGRTNRLNKIEFGAVSVLPGLCSGGANAGNVCYYDSDCGASGSCKAPRGQGGGQVGAPCGCSGCFTTGNPEADLAFERIQGNWQYDRKDPLRADTFHIGTFHAKQFNSLICGCCSAGLGNEEDGPGNCAEGTHQLDTAGICFIQGASRDALDGQVCGDRYTGPLPRPAPANIICFSGIGDWVDTNGRKTDKVAFRVEAEDRGEPSVGRNADETCDYHRIRIWFPKGTCRGTSTACKSNAGCARGVSCDFLVGESPEQLADAACCTNANSPDEGTYSDVPCLRDPDIDDGGNLEHGNIQIHPTLPNTNRGICPVPHGEEGSCQQPVGADGCD